MDDDRLRLAAARADFLESGEAGAAGVPDMVAASWLRSRTAGVAADTYQVPFSDDIDPDSRLGRCARPVLERLELDMSDVPVCIALSDARARIIERRDCSSAVGRVLDRVDFNPGFSFAEGGVGTNGIGTVFEAGQPISVVGAAHFNESLVPFACTGAPILDPLTRRIEGVLDVSLLSESWSPLIHALVKSAAADIGNNLLRERSQAQQALFETYLEAQMRRHDAVIAVGDSIIVNDRARHLLDPTELLIVQQHADLLRGRRTTTELIVLPDNRILQARVRQVIVDEQVVGVVLVVVDAAERRRSGSIGSAIPQLRSAPDLRSAAVADDAAGAEVAVPAPVAWSRSPAFRRAGAEASAALRARMPLLVTGEAGSGRFHLLAEVFHDLHATGRQISVSAEELTSDSTLELRPMGGEDTLIAIRDLERLAPPAARRLRQLVHLVGRRPDLAIAATLLNGPRCGRVDEATIGLFEASVELPALRHRGVDLPELAARVLAEEAPGRRLRLSPAAARLVSAYAWPGNLAQLREALQEALGRRPVGEIQADDLPAYCRTAGHRRLTRLEVAERDAIVRALRDCDGNRLQAARRLGMSRSSLYRKLKAYAITSA